MCANPQSWQPTEIQYYIKTIRTSTDTTIVETDVGRGYLKAMGNRSGEHVLACELVGTKLAKWFGLPTLDFSVLRVTCEDDIPFDHQRKAAPGPAFITRHEAGNPWGGSQRELRKLANPGAVTRLVVFDTWVRNCDRYSDNGKRVNFDNVFLSSEGTPDAKLTLKAIDHGHCFTCGRNLSRKLASIECIKDDRLYGCFPAFRNFLSHQEAKLAAVQLGQISQTVAQDIVEAIPSEWDVNDSAREALVTFILQRATWLRPKIEQLLWP